MVYVLAIVAVVTAIAFIIGYYFFKKDALYVLGIGAAVSSNVYNVGSYGITEGGIVWGIDAIIYALFVFCIIVACKDFDRKSAMAITYSSIGGIMLTAFFDFMAKWMSAGFAEDLIWGFVSYAVSAVATFLGVYIALLVYDKLRDKVYSWFNMGLCMLIIEIINSLVYFGIMAIIGGLGDNFGITLAGSYIVKVIGLIFFVGVYYIYEIFNKKRINVNLDTPKSTEENKFN